MREVLQTRTGAPHGNCHAACMAAIFELDIDQVPDHRWPDDVPWQEAQDGPQQTDRGRRVRDERYEVWQAWLAERGLTTVGFPPGGWVPKGYALGSVVNPRGIPHYVVCLDGKAVWDPNPLQDSYDQPIELLEYFIAMNPASDVLRPLMSPMSIAPVVTHRALADQRFVQARHLLEAIVGWLSTNVAAVQMSDVHTSMTASGSTGAAFRFFMRAGGHIDVRWKRPTRTPEAPPASTTAQGDGCGL